MTIPIGESGALSLQHYDIPKSLGQLRQILQARGYEMQTSTNFDRFSLRTRSLWASLATAGFVMLPGLVGTPRLTMVAADGLCPRLIPVVRRLS